MLTLTKILLATAVIILVLVAYVLYPVALLRGSNKPHLFSWLILTATRTSSALRLTLN